MDEEWRELAFPDVIYWVRVEQSHLCDWRFRMSVSVDLESALGILRSEPWAPFVKILMYQPRTPYHSWRRQRRLNRYIQQECIDRCERGNTLLVARVACAATLWPTSEWADVWTALIVELYQRFPRRKVGLASEAS